MSTGPISFMSSGQAATVTSLEETIRRMTRELESARLNEKNWMPEYVKASVDLSARMIYIDVKLNTINRLQLSFERAQLAIDQNNVEDVAAELAAMFGGQVFASRLVSQIKSQLSYVITNSMFSQKSSL